MQKCRFFAGLLALPGMLFLLFSPLMLFAQEQQDISGTVLDSRSQAPLPGVSIGVKGTTAGVATNTEGKYRIRARSTDTLVFSFLGYASVREGVNGRATINVTLQEGLSSLEEVVVVGYGTLKKSSVTAAVTKLENKNLDQVPVARPEAALQGRLAGVNISQTRNSPGAVPLIRIRGVGSIDAGNDPLVVIDGFPGGSLGNISMNDVASIEVLKDASSAAIYGSRAAGGVIIVTTKRGRTGKPTLSFNAYGGVSKAIGHTDWMRGEEYYDYAVRFQNREFAWVGGNTSLPIWGDPSRPDQFRVSDVLKNGGVNTNWQNAALQTAPFQSYDLSVSGGTDAVKYYASGIVRSQYGTLKNTWMRTYGARANLDIRVNKAIRAGLMINPTYINRRIIPNTMVDFSKYPPFVEIYGPNGGYPKARDYWGLVVSGQANPMAVLDGTFNYASTFNNIGELFVSVDLARGLTFKSSVGTNIAYNTTDNFQASFANTASAATGSAADSRSFNLVNENVLSYSRAFKEKHNIDAIAGASYQVSRSRASSMAAIPGSFNNDIIHTLNNAIIDPAATTNTRSQWSLISYFARAHYGYKDKYLVSASIRTDGSSRFGPDNKWGLFPSASAAWRVSQEPFMKSVKVISDLKLRASYGATGNYNIGDFDYLGKVTDFYYSPGGILSKGLAQSSYGNTELSWEKTHEYDLGIDLGLFNNRLSITVDYYRKSTTGLLYNVSVPAITGFTSALSNIGEVQNRGVEVEIHSKNLSGAFNWETSFNMSANRNKVASLGGVNERIYTDRYGMSWLLRVGEPMFSYFGYRTIGVLQNQAEIERTPVLSGSKPGNPKYEDVNKDGRISPADRMILGSFMPKVILGMVNNFSWKQFDLSIALQASLGAKMYNFENQYYQGSLLGAMRRSLVANQWWSEAEPGDGKMPAAALSQLEFQGNSDVYIEDASFLAVRNLNLGYTLPSSLTKRLRMGSCRIYTSINNLLMLTKKEFHGYNPEGYTSGEVSGINSTPGYNGGSEPVNRVYTFGINFNF
jgi:TonB-linked SusC/RagA family outer membrane protein